MTIKDGSGNVTFIPEANRISGEELQKLVDSLYLVGMRPTCEAIVKSKLAAIVETFSGEQRSTILKSLAQEAAAFDSLYSDL